MSISPFMTPDQSRRRREDARRRRTRRRAIAIAGLALAILAGAVVMALARTHEAHGSNPGSSSASNRAATHSRAAGDAGASAGAHSAENNYADAAHALGAGSGLASARLSQENLPLGTPPLILSGIGDPARDPLHTAFAEPPRAGLLFNLQTGQVLWQHNPYIRLRMASLTKMMTALLTVQSAAPDAPVLITKEAVNMPGSKVGLLPLGHHVRVETLLYGLLLPSGNDAAVALARHVAGSVNKFIVRMNAEAAQLGMGCTRYSSPSGYYDRGNYTCAADLAELAHVDLQQPRIAHITHTYTAALPFPIKGGKLFLYNNNPLLIYHYPGTTGLKTGYTEDAGRCLVATATRGGVSLGVVLLHSPDPGTQAAQLLTEGFDDVYHLHPIPEPPIPGGV
jgi:serine-type D-Ala-D-Ala carboxypeptidase (penicillin-binding protein 5/6)